MKKYAFSIRLPEDLYITVSRRAQASGRDRIAEIIDLLEVGLSKTVDFEGAVKRFVMRQVTADELKSLGGGA